jgi:hypothetical protein
MWKSEMDKESEDVLRDIKVDLISLEMLVELILSKQFAADSGTLSDFDMFAQDIQRQMLTIPAPCAPPQITAEVRRRVAESMMIEVV